MSHASSEIPVDDEYVDDSDDESARTVASTLRAYQYRFNRRFHEDQRGTHPFPNDRISADNELVAHTLFLQLLNDKPYIAPIEEPKNIVDLGTGTGLWAMMMADWFDGDPRPLAMVKGIDQAPQQEGSVQPNLEFEYDDITKDWTSSTLYDLVHIRLLWGAIHDWPKVFSESFKHMKSGGYLQFADIEFFPQCDDNTMPADTVFKKWEQLGSQFKNVSRRSFCIASETKQELADAGFVDIEERRYKLPVGVWSSNPRYRDLGRMYAAYWETGMEGWAALPATDYLQWPVEEVHKLVRETRDTIARRTQHVYYYAVIICAKKP